MLSAPATSSGSDPQVRGGPLRRLPHKPPERLADRPSGGRGGVATQRQLLELEYGSARDFAQDFRANLSNGGVFVPTQRTFALRDFVVVRLRLPWCNRMIDLEGEVVHIVPKEMASMGAQPG